MRIQRPIDEIDPIPALGERAQRGGKPAESVDPAPAELNPRAWDGATRGDLLGLLESLSRVSVVVGGDDTTVDIML